MPAVFDKSLPNPLSSFEQAMPMLNAAGITSSNQKLSTYYRFLLDGKSRQIDHYDPETFLVLWREVHELAFVLDAFRINNIPLPVNQLRKALSGAAIPTHDPDDDSSRNYLLELRVAVYFLACGFSVSLEEECDVVARLGRKTFFVECKRLYSVKKIHLRIKQAAKQALTRLDRNAGESKARAILWVDPSPILLRECPFYCAISR